MPNRWSTPFKHLALLAMLALVLLPPMGRLAQAAATEAVALAQATATERLVPMPSHGEHCASMAEAVTDRPDLPPTLPGDDCAYCPILAALSLPSAQGIVVPPLVWPAQWAAGGSLGQRGRTTTAGLGARGPPRAI